MLRSFPRAELTLAAGAAPRSWEQVRGGGYGTNTTKWRVVLDDGRRVFVKVALDELAARWLRAEAHVYRSLDAPFLPTLVAWHDSQSRTCLAIDDLSDAYWPPPWSPEQVGLVCVALEALHATDPPPDLESLENLRAELDGWQAVTADPKPFLSTDICSHDWLQNTLPILSRAAAESVLEGTDLVHFDVRSDNLCLRDDDVLFVDWNYACIGNGLIDLVSWAPSLRLEDGPDPWELVPESGGMASLVAGYFAARAGLPAPPTAPTVREFQLRQLEVALPWAARELDLPPLES